MLKKLQDHLLRHSLRKTRATLLTMPERQLEDIGISRHLLLQGTAKWPWRIDGSNDGQLPAVEQRKFKSSDVSKAIKELSDMSDSQLRDIGIDRGSIRHAAKHGVATRNPRHVA